MKRITMIAMTTALTTTTTTTATIAPIRTRTVESPTNDIL